MPRGLGSRGLPVASLPHGAPPEARTPFPGVRAQCITRHACGAWSGEWFPEDLVTAGRTGRARTGDLVLPKHARYLLRHHPMNLMGCDLAGRNRTSGPIPPNHAPYHSALAGRLAGGPPRIRTGNLLLAGESLFQLELAAHRLPARTQRAAKSGLRGHR
jgi:hypothetical protein